MRFRMHKTSAVLRCEVEGIFRDVMQGPGKLESRQRSRPSWRRGMLGVEAKLELALAALLIAKST